MRSDFLKSKFLSNVILYLLCLHWNDISAGSKACMNQKYVEYSDEYLRRRYSNEYSIFNSSKFVSKFHLNLSEFSYYKNIHSNISVRNALFGDWSSEFELTADKEETCACAIYKMKYEKSDVNGENKKKIFKKILRHMEVSDYEVTVKISHFFYSSTYIVPSVLCVSREDTCIISKGYKRKSSSRQVYDIYVATMSENNRPSFRGVIRKVDVESSAMETKPVQEVEIPIQ